MSITNWIFDHEHTKLISARREEFLGRLLKDIKRFLGNTTALDAGCGIGHFAQYLLAQGFDVSAFDGREQNVLEARQRAPHIQFYVQNVENPNLTKLGMFELVVCFGLLYHVENPFLAVRNLYSITRNTLIIETMVAPHSNPAAVMINEIPTEDQALNFVALIPSEISLINMLYQAGFQKVYQCVELPKHEEFEETSQYKRRRTILVAAKIPLSSPLLREASPVHQSHGDVWRKKSGLVPKASRRLVSLFSRVKISLQSRLMSRSLYLTRLSWGAWWFSGPDSISKCLRSLTGFEEQEQNFLFKFIQPGWTVLDVGAHHGIYSLLASKRTGRKGKVIAFEPSPRERKRLRRNLIINRSQNVKVEALGLSDKEGTATLYVVGAKDTGCNSMRPPAVPFGIHPTDITITTLDRYLEQNHIKQVDFIKVDIEGAELEAFKGAEKLLTGQSRPIIVYEISDLRTVPWGYQSVELYDFLEAKGFKHFALSENGKLQFCPRKEQFDENLIAVPEEKLRMVSAFMVESNA
jgi:FkbM family methyltransferase